MSNSRSTAQSARKHNAGEFFADGATVRFQASERFVFDIAKVDGPPESQHSEWAQRIAGLLNEDRRVQSKVDAP